MYRLLAVQPQRSLVCGQVGCHASPCDRPTGRHDITPFASHGRPICHLVLKYRLTFFLASWEATSGWGVHVLQTTSTQKAKCTAHVVCTRCIHVLHAACPHWEVHCTHGTHI